MKLKIGHRTILLRPMREGEAADQGARGLYLPNEGHIAVDASQPADVQAEVVIHEVGHCVWEVYGFPTKVDEEECVTLFGKAFAQVFRDNPALIGAIQAAASGASIFPRAGAT